MNAGTFAAVTITLYVAHHVGDYWVQTDHQARHKSTDRRACLAHVASYLATQAVMVIAVDTLFALGLVKIHVLLVSGATHYFADRREPLQRLAHMLPGKSAFWVLGVPRPGRDDNPSLGTGAWALDQSWHIFWGVWVTGLVMVVP